MTLRLAGTLSRFVSFVSTHSRLKSGHDGYGLFTLSLTRPLIIFDVGMARVMRRSRQRAAFF